MDERGNKSIYLKTVINQIPRLLSLCDRNLFSPTCGCFDRDYWQYKRVDIPFARMQESVLTLASLYKNNAPGNIYFNVDKISDIIQKGINFWADLQHSDGSFSDYYPNERAIVVTAFTLYAISETLSLCPEFKDENVLSAVKSAANFLIKNKEKNAVNQEIVSTAALYNVYPLINDDLIKFDVKKAADRKLEDILKNQSEEGYFNEYGGADIGYLSVSIDYLAKIYKLSGNNQVYDAIKNAINFISYFVHPNGSMGGEYTSRNTQYIIPHGFEIISEKYPTALAIRNQLIDSLQKRISITPYTFDDRYMALYLYNYLQAYFEQAPEIIEHNKEHDLPYIRKPFTKLFRYAGILVVKKPNFYSIIGLTTGGAIKAFSLQNKSIFSDTGYIAKIGHSIIASGCLDQNSKINITENKININGSFYKINYMKPTTLKHVALRMLTLSGAFSYSLRKIIRNTLISAGKKVPVAFERIIELNEESIDITDKIISQQKIRELTTIDTFSYRYIPSAQYFNIHELLTKGILHGDGKKFDIHKHLDIRKNETEVSYGHI